MLSASLRLRNSFNSFGHSCWVRPLPRAQMGEVVLVVATLAGPGGARETGPMRLWRCLNDIGGV